MHIATRPNRVNLSVHRRSLTMAHRKPPPSVPRLPLASPTVHEGRFVRHSRSGAPRIASGLGVRTDELLHLGDQWLNDILGAASAGCCARHEPTGEHPPRPSMLPDGLTARITAIGGGVRHIIPAPQGINGMVDEGV